MSLPRYVESERGCLSRRGGGKAQGLTRHPTRRSAERRRRRRRPRVGALPRQMCQARVRMLWMSCWGRCGEVAVGGGDAGVADLGLDEVDEFAFGGELGRM